MRLPVALGLLVAAQLTVVGVGVAHAATTVISCPDNATAITNLQTALNTSGTYTFDSDCSQIALTSPLTMTSGATVKIVASNGGGCPDLDGNSSTQLLQVSSGSLLISCASFTGGVVRGVAGADGANGQPGSPGENATSNSDGGAGDVGAAGAEGGNGVAAQGGAIFIASGAMLSLNHVSFISDSALGGNGGNGGSGGKGGDGGDPEGAGFLVGLPGGGGNGGDGGKGADGQGGAIYNAGSLTLTGVSFQYDGAKGGRGGAGGDGGGGGSGATPTPILGITKAQDGSPGNAGVGGLAGVGQGGDVYNAGTLSITGTSTSLQSGATGGAGGQAGGLPAGCNNGAELPPGAGPAGASGADGGAGQGGSIYNDGPSFSVSGTSFTQDVAIGGDGGDGMPGGDSGEDGPGVGGSGADGGDAAGGAIYDASANGTFAGDSFSSNGADAGYGGDGKSGGGGCGWFSGARGGDGGNGGNAQAGALYGGISVTGATTMHNGTTDSSAEGGYNGGVTVTITGAGFTNATAVDFVLADGTSLPATSFSVISDTEIQAVSPAITPSDLLGGRANASIVIKGAPTSAGTFGNNIVTAGTGGSAGAGGSGGPGQTAGGAGSPGAAGSAVDPDDSTSSPTGSLGFTYVPPTVISVSPGIGSFTQPTPVTVHGIGLAGADTITLSPTSANAGVPSQTLSATSSPPDQVTVTATGDDTVTFTAPSLSALGIQSPAQSVFFDVQVGAPFSTTPGQTAQSAVNSPADVFEYEVGNFSVTVQGDNGVGGLHDSQHLFSNDTLIVNGSGFDPTGGPITLQVDQEQIVTQAAAKTIKVQMPLGGWYSRDSMGCDNTLTVEQDGKTVQVPLHGQPEAFITFLDGSMLAPISNIAVGTGDPICQGESTLAGVNAILSPFQASDVKAFVLDAAANKDNMSNLAGAGPPGVSVEGPHGTFSFQPLYLGGTAITNMILAPDNGIQVLGVVPITTGGTLCVQYEPSQYVTLTSNGADHAIDSGGIPAGPGENVTTGQGNCPAARNVTPSVPAGDLDATAFNPSSVPGVTMPASSFVAPANSNLVGITYFSRSVFALSGLTLTGADPVYSTGSMLIAGGLHGDGSLIAARNLTVSGTANIEADANFALFADEDTVLLGEGNATGAASGTPYPPSVLTYNAATGLNIGVQTGPPPYWQLNVPAGALPDGTQIGMFSNSPNLHSQVPAGESYLLSFSVYWASPDGSDPDATQPITLTITSASIKAGDTVYVWTPTGLQPATATVTDGKAVITMTSDPSFVIAAPAAATQLTFSSEPAANVYTGTKFPVTVSEQDANGNPVTTDHTTSVNLAITPGTGAAEAQLYCTPNPTTVSNGTATFSCSITAPGTGYTLTATASGLTPATSDPFTVTRPANQGGGQQATNTTTSLVSSADPSHVGEQVTFTATVTPTPPGGTLQFVNNGDELSVCSEVPVDPNTGTATCTLAFTDTRSYDMQVYYSGDGSFLASQSPLLTQTVVSPGQSMPTSTSTELTSSTNPAVTGERVVYTAKVTPAPDGGSARFLEDGKTIAGCRAVPVNTSTGEAACASTYPKPGARLVQAVYDGTSNFTGSQSGTLSEAVRWSLTLLGRPSGHSGAIALTLHCAQGSGGCLTSIAVTVADAGHGHQLRSAATRAHSGILIAGKRIRIAAGKTQATTISLNHEGRQLLKGSRRLHAELTIRLRIDHHSYIRTIRKMTVEPRVEDRSPARIA